MARPGFYPPALIQELLTTSSGMAVSHVFLLHVLPTGVGPSGRARPGLQVEEVEPSQMEPAARAQDAAPALTLGPPWQHLNPWRLRFHVL